MGLIKGGMLCWQLHNITSSDVMLAVADPEFAELQEKQLVTYFYMRVIQNPYALRIEEYENQL